MKTLTEEQALTIIGLLRGVDELVDSWSTFEKAIQGEGIEDAEAAIEELQALLYA